jgi:hypothetical protein
LPADAAALGALIAALIWGLVSLVRARAPWRSAVPFRWQLAFWSALAAALSAAYVPYYLRGAPRVIDATSYLLAAKSIASGAFCFPTGLPSAAVRGRFLVGADARECVGVLFPPGYPLALAGAVAVGAPLLLGPLTAALQTAVVLLLARRHIGASAVGVAGALSVLCACARYHTADTMSHGWAALLLSGACYAWGFERPWADRVGGVCWGWLVATRPVTGLVALVALVLLTSLSQRDERTRARAWLLVGVNSMLGALPFIALLLLYDHALTGDALHSPQSLYYALSDGEPGCFRYGFGANVGCKHEHGDFIARFMPHGYGVFDALATTSRRLCQHLRDAGNSELGAVALVAACFSRRVRRQHAWLPLVIGAQILAYLPFYYDGNYPAGGARMFADVLPLEQLLVAAWLAPFSWRGLAGPLALFGFAFHTANDHALLGSREGGRPYFEPQVVEAAGVSRGLVFIPSDHGFNLAYAPNQAAPPLEFLRWRGDGHDRVAWEQRGKPPAYVYEWFFGITPVPSLVPYDVSRLAYRFEAENEWPVLAISDGWARPEQRSSACVSGGRGLVFSATGAEPSVTLELPVPAPGVWRVHIGSEGDVVPDVSIDGVPLGSGFRLQASGDQLAEALPEELMPEELMPEENGPCRERVSAPLVLQAGARRVSFGVPPGTTATLDYVELVPSARMNR